MPSVHPVLRNLPEYPIVRVERAKRERLDADLAVFDFGTGDPLDPTPGFIQDALRDGVESVCRYPNPRGTPELRAAAAGYLQRRFGVELDPATQIASSRGSKEAIFHLPFAFLDVASGRDTVVFPTPGYTVYESGTRFCGGVAHGVALTPENDFLLEPWTLPREVRERIAILWVNYPHNPSGARAPRSYLESLTAFAREEGIVLCSDECYVDVFEGEAPISLLEFGTENLITLFSCSKRSGMTGYRSGFLAGDANLIETYSRLRPNLGVATPLFVERAATAAWSDDAHVSSRNAIFSQKRALFREFFDAEEIPYWGRDATFFLWFRVPGGEEGESYCRRLLDATGIVTIPGTYFGAGGEGLARVALVPPLEECRAAIALWREWAAS
ncbi:MAG: succinyldiaminopimelate transaminase [Planctomycetes bacterium]|nr:succinyldiaminopimelate transaminase [Planctomycetota bacterium]